jgi:glycosyltransferase involved in cell wall biosynthesis
LKKRILIISDHAFSLSGVGVQSRFLIDGLIETGQYSFLQLGGAVKHEDYKTLKVNEDFIIKPIDGFGNKNMLRSILLNDKPEAIIIFTDPRFFTWLFEMEDEIRQVCPILWWHVWDNRPTPKFNSWMYESVDAVNCHSYLTYLMCKEDFSKKTAFIPHSIPRSLYYRLERINVIENKVKILGESKKDSFICLWANRNCKRKRPGDVIYSWKLFVEKLSNQHRKPQLIMHTNPYDKSGLNLIALAKRLDVLDTVSFSSEQLDFDYMNILYNIADVTINISFNEGFGLTTLESMMTGTPIIATKTGGLYRQVIDYRDNTENGIGLNPEIKSLVGSQEIPYIFEDYVSCETIANALYEFYNMSFDEKEVLSKKVEDYANIAFDYKKTIELWDASLKKTIKKFHESVNSDEVEVELL